MDEVRFQPQRARPSVPDDPIVGIDLGTTNSLVAYCFDSGPRILGGASDGAMVPSVVRFHPDGMVSVGEAARRDRGAHPSETVSSAKRLMGRSASETAEFARGFSVALVEGPRGIAALRVGGRVITPHEVAAEILRELRSIAEADLGVASGNGKGQIFVRGEVIKTVPESQIVETLIEEAMKLAEEMSGLSGAPVVTTS